MKRESRIVDGTPQKRLFWSIISDYNVSTSICELIDNALDIWIRNGKQADLCVEIDLDIHSRSLRITDNAGGIPESDLHVLISPGASLNRPDENLIGLFGVGSKRAVVALAQTVRIRTRREEGKTYQIDIDENWLEDEDWEMPVYEVDQIAPNTTVIDLMRLRYTLDDMAQQELRVHLRETYGRFLRNDRFNIKINSEALEPLLFDAWAYPPSFEPRYYMFEVNIEDGASVGVEIYAGLIRDRDPSADNYGVYFYCNDRLIMKEVKEPAVGYIRGAAGIPHSDASLARVIVGLHGAARLMPWNSTKTAINFNKPVFTALLGILIPTVSDFSSLSRRLKGDWEGQVFRFDKGEIRHLEINDIEGVRKSFLPPLPRVRKKPIERLKEVNKSVIADRPWVVGLLESLAAQELISRQRLETRNRIALILLDSTFEIALKEYIVHTDGLNLKGQSLEELFKQRDAVISVVRQKVAFPPTILQRIRHYYLMRNKLVHERATVDVPDSDIANFRDAVVASLVLLFNVKV
ncbi:MAG TPA: ATP-binding protein [Thermoanaerobaculia bacterium]|nr:ATP-binding protein [Thermoanaerobaculia bacterium]